MFFFLGLIIGSFLNVMIYRLPRGESLLGPRSHCPVCEHPLSIIDLIPLLGYLFRRGRCAYCSEPISLRYPLVELLTAILFVNIHWYFAWTVHTLAGLIFTSILLVAAFTDIETGIIPDFITYPALVAGLVLSCFTIGFQDSFVGALILGGVFLIVALISRRNGWGGYQAGSSYRCLCWYTWGFTGLCDFFPAGRYLGSGSIDKQEGWAQISHQIRPLPGSCRLDGLDVSRGINQSLFALLTLGKAGFTLSQ